MVEPGAAAPAAGDVDAVAGAEAEADKDRPSLGCLIGGPGDGQVVIRFMTAPRNWLGSRCAV